MMIMATVASTQNMVTEKANEPGFTLNLVPLMAWYMAAMVQAIPIPRKTLTALLPVTLPTEESAYSSPVAATLLANVSEISIQTIKISNIALFQWNHINLDLYHDILVQHQIHLVNSVRYMVSLNKLVNMN